MCLLGQNLNWFKLVYDAKCMLKPSKILAISKIDYQNLHLINGNFMMISGHFCANCMSIFQKIEIQTVILSCWTSLNHDWYNSFDSNAKKKKQKKKPKNRLIFSTIRVFICFCPWNCERNSCHNVKTFLLSSGFPAQFVTHIWRA